MKDNSIKKKRYDLEKDFSNRTIAIDVVFNIAVALILVFLPYIIRFLAKKPLCIGVATMLESMFAHWWNMVPTWLVLYLFGVFLLNFSKARIREWGDSALISFFISNLISLLGISGYFLEVANMPGVEEAIFSKTSFPVKYLILGVFTIIYALELWEAKKKVDIVKAAEKK